MGSRPHDRAAKGFPPLIDSGPLTPRIFGFWPASRMGSPTALNFGSGDSDSFQYDTDTGRMAQYNSTVNGSSVTGNLGWNGNGTLASLDISDSFNSCDQQNCTYSYDALARLVLPPSVHDESQRRLWQRWFYPYGIYSEKKQLGKLDYMHNSPVTRGLVGSPGDWSRVAGSSWRFYFLRDTSMLPMDPIL